MKNIWFYAISKKTGDSKVHCRKYGSWHSQKNEVIAGTQRYKCKRCGFQFTRETPHEKPMKDKVLALVLYLSGLSMKYDWKNCRVEYPKRHAMDKYVL